MTKREIKSLVRLFNSGVSRDYCLMAIIQSNLPSIERPTLNKIVSNIELFDSIILLPERTSNEPS